MDKLIKSGTTLYKQVAQSISSAIKAGDFPPNTKLPTQAQLCEQYQVSRITIGKALDILESQGVIKKQAGRGAFVCPEAQINPSKVERDLIWNIDSLMRWCNKGYFALKGLELIDSPKHYKRILKTNHMVCVKGIRKVGSISLAFVKVYVDMASVMDRPATDFIHTQVIEMVEEKTGKKAMYIEQIVSAIIPEPNGEVAQELELTSTNEPIVSIESRYRDKKGKVLEVVINYVNPAKWEYSFVLPREATAPPWIEREPEDSP